MEGWWRLWRLRRLWRSRADPTSTILHQPPQPSLTFYEADLHRPGEQARPMPPAQQFGQGAPAGFSVVDGGGVPVHADETIGAGVVEPAAVRLRVRQRLRAVGETVLNARLQVACDVAHQGRPEVTAHHVPAERQRQPRLRAPPLAQVDPELQPAVGA